MCIRDRFFTISLFAAPQRGVVARWVRHHTLRRKIIMQNFLRALYELGESQQGSPSPRESWGETEVALKRSWSRPQLDAVIARAASDGLVERREAGWALTKMGLIEAIQTVRAHRLWEVFLIDQADIAPDHVDRDADLIEHILPRELLVRLEEKLRAQGRLPEHLPGSPHAIASHDSAGANA